MSIYLNLLCEKDPVKASKLVKDLLTPSPTDLFDSKIVEEKGWTEEDCLQKLLDDAMPEKTKETKTRNPVMDSLMGGATVFMAKKRSHKVRYPKSYDPLNPGLLPDPERWLPKWQRSRFKKLAKKKGIYLKGAQGDAQISTDVSGGLAKSTAHQEASTGGNKKGGNKRQRK